jgi:hypothetical protein
VLRANPLYGHLAQLGRVAMIDDPRQNLRVEANPLRQGLVFGRKRDRLLSRHGIDTPDFAERVGPNENAQQRPPPE